MRTELFDYDLPEDRIARHPAERRDGARLLVVHADSFEHRRMSEFAELVPEGSLLVVNDTRVRRARVFGVRHGTGGRIELFFLERLPEPASRAGSERWSALGRASKPLRAGTRIDAGELVAEVLGRDEEGILTLEVEAPGGVESWLEANGHVPIPPYLGRLDEPSDVERYQTVYARRTASVAAPTAGLHLTPEAFARLEARGVEIGRVELEVGLGTFKPVEVEDPAEHQMHEERYEVSAATAEALNQVRRAGGRLCAVGTTALRTLESVWHPDRGYTSGSGETRIFIRPPTKVHSADFLLTNFHLPRSTLLMLVAAFAGYEFTMEAYAAAVREGYRFYSYGDAMLLL